MDPIERGIYKVIIYEKKPNKYVVLLLCNPPAVY